MQSMIGLLLLALSGGALIVVVGLLWRRAGLTRSERRGFAFVLVVSMVVGGAGLLNVWSDRATLRQGLRALTSRASDAGLQTAESLRDRWNVLRHGKVNGLSFSDITPSAGTAGPSGPGETGGHGVFWTDMDQSGLPDLYVTMNWNQPMADLLFRNMGDGRFVEEASVRGVDDFDGGSHGACFADLNNNGHFDLFNGATLEKDGSDGLNRLYQNDGEGQFRDVTFESGLGEAPRERTRAVLCFDMTGNGRLDLFALSGYLGSDDPEHDTNQVHLNHGEMRFETVTTGEAVHARAGQGAIDTDINSDGSVDILAANRTGPMLILLNDGTGNFTRIDPASIGIRHRAGDGISSADVNRNGHLDLLLAGPDGVHLYLNQGDGTFAYGQGFAEIRQHVYMGGFADLNNNGHVDLVLAGVNRVYLNNGEGRFQPGPALPMRGVEDPRAVAFADIDANGTIDFALAAKRSTNRLFRNDLAPSGNWLKVQLVSPQGQAGAFGSRIYAYRAGDLAGGLLGMREARSNQGYLAQDDPVLHFGLGDVEAVDLLVRFLDGTVVTRASVTAGATVTIDGRTANGAEAR